MKHFLWLFLSGVALATACQAKVEGTAMHEGGAGTAGSEAGGGTGGNTPGSLDLQCTQSELGSPVLRLLTATEFANTVGDIFPQVKGNWTNSLPANSVSAFGFANDASAVVGPQLAPS